MARWRLRVEVPAYAAGLCLSVLTFLSLDAAAFTAAPRIAGEHGARARTRHISLAARRGGVEPREGGQECGRRAGDPVSPCSRTAMLRSLGLVGSAVVFGQALVEQAGAAVAQEGLPTVGKITKSGVKYFEYRDGDGSNPRWGQDCVVRFVMYGRASPDDKLVKIQASENNKETYLFKHGNGRQIKGMEEGIHSMRVGGKRRIIMPQQLGYTVQGLGPFPADPRKRDVLVKVLKSFEGSNKGELVMDVELMEAFDDEADQGYYEDETVSLEQLEEIVAETGRFSGGMPFEKLPGQVSTPLDDGFVAPPKVDVLPGQLGEDVGGG